MKKILFLLFIMFEFCQADGTATKFAILSEGLSNAKTKDTKIALNILIKEIFNDSSNKEVYIDYYEKEENVVENFTNGHIAALTLNTISYIKNKEKLDSSSRDWYAFIATQEEYISYVIITHKSGNIKSIKDLKNRTLGLHNENIIEKLYLDHTLLTHKLPLHKEYLSNIKLYNKHSRVLMKLFFKKIDACVIPTYTWNMMTEMNPQLSKKLTILDESEKIFMPTISLISNNISDRIFDIHHTNSLKLNKSAKGKQILTLLKCNKYKSVGKSFLDSMNSYYQEYLELKKR